MDIRASRKISLRLDVDLAERLQFYADQERVPVSQVLRHLVLRFLPSDTEKEVRPSIPTARGVADAGLSERRQDEFSSQVCVIFDEFRAQGLDAKEAAKRTNFRLKDHKHPWATYEVIADILRKAGKFRKVKTWR
jgi:hypothetical protein